MQITNTPNTNKDKLLMVAILVLVGAGVFINYHFNEMESALRFTGCILFFCALIGLAALTSRGKKFWIFAKDARNELLKVVWPKREETIKITIVVAGLVLVTSIILWCIDSILLWIISSLTKFLI